MIEIEIYVMHCTDCGRYYNHECQELNAPRGSQYAWEVIAIALDILDRTGMHKHHKASVELKEKTGHSIAPSLISDWWCKYGKDT